MNKTTHRWTRRASAASEGQWLETLDFLDPQMIAFVSRPASRMMNIEVYADAKITRDLGKRFGGRVEKLQPLQRPPSPDRVISIRGKLKIFSNEQAWRDYVSGKWKVESGKLSPRLRRSRAPKAQLSNSQLSTFNFQLEKRGIYVPAGMAFGTGGHATTATCLRLLCDASPAEGFTAADVGCGSGILAIGCELLGARSVDAFDNDEAAVRIAHENAEINRCRAISTTQQDVFKWKPRKKYDVVLANLFSEILIAAAPRLASAVRPGGTLIFSGVLHRQSAEVVEAFARQGLRLERLVQRGKWCAGAVRS